MKIDMKKVYEDAVVAAGDAGTGEVVPSGQNQDGVVKSGIKTDDVLGKWDPEKGCLGKKDFHIPKNVLGKGKILKRHEIPSLKKKGNKNPYAKDSKTITDSKIMKHTTEAIKKAIDYWQNKLDEMEKLDEAGVDDILARWNSSHSSTAKKDEPDETPKKIITYTMGNNTHALMQGDLIFGIYLKKSENAADYSIYRLSEPKFHRFKELKGKTQTSTIKTFFTNNAEKIEGEERGKMSVSEFIDEIKRLVGEPSHRRKGALFVAGLQANYYHYSKDPRHRGKTTLTTQTTGKTYFDLDNVDVADDKFAVKEREYSKTQIEEAIAKWQKVLDSMEEQF